MLIANTRESAFATAPEQTAPSISNDDRTALFADALDKQTQSHNYCHKTKASGVYIVRSEIKSRESRKASGDPHTTRLRFTGFVVNDPA